MFKKNLCLNNFAYFDNAASTPVLKAAADAALQCFNFCYANPSSLHKFGIMAENILISTKKKIADILKCEPNEIVFTPSATISTNIAILGSVKNFKFVKNFKKKIVSTAIEHPATLNCLAHLEKNNFEIIKVKPNFKTHVFSVDDFLSQIDERTCLVSLMHVNNENGLILPIEKIVTAIKFKNPKIVVHLDCVQSFTKIPINLSTLPVDLVSISGHKINAPKGIGVLFVRKNYKLTPIFFGGEQEKKICPGTQNVAAIAGLNVACDFNHKNMTKNLKLFENFRNLIKTKCSKCNLIKFNFEDDNNLPSILNLSVTGVKSQVMLNFLDNEGFMVSSGSACAKGKKGYVLTNLGYNIDRQDSSIRISFSFQNTIEQVNDLADALLKGAKTILKYK